jgi:uncharacterized protein
MKQISITTSGITIQASLNDTITAEEIWKILPIKATVNVWGEEIYFTIPLKTPLEQNATQDVEIGTITYWPTGPALCIFFGPTPVSTSTKPRAYSPVNIIGHTIDNPSVLKAVTDGAKIIVEALKE